MKQISFILCLFLFLLTVSSAIAQDGEIMNLELISPDNLSRIEELARWESQRGPVAASFSPDGQRLALVLNDGTIKLIDTATMETSRVLEGAETNGQRLDFSPDGTRLLLSRENGTYLLWDVASGTRLAFHENDKGGIRFAASQNLNAYYLYRFDTMTVSVYDLVTGEARVSDLPADFIPYPELNADGSLLLTVDMKATVSVWDTFTGEIKFHLKPEWEFTTSSVGDLQGMGFTPQGDIWTNWQTYLPSTDKVVSQSPIQFWDADTGQEFRRLKGQHWYEALYFDPTGHYVAAVGTDAFRIVDSRIWIWDLQDEQEVGMSQGTTGGASVAFSPDGRLYAYGGGTSDRLRVHQVGIDHPGVTLETMNTYTDPQFSSNGKLLLNVGFDIRLWGVLSDE